VREEAEGRDGLGRQWWKTIATYFRYKLVYSRVMAWNGLEACLLFWFWYMAIVMFSKVAK